MRPKSGSLQSWIVTFGGVGRVRAAPGTVASFVAAAILYGVWMLLDSVQVPGLFAIWQIILLVGLGVAAMLTVQWGDWAVSYYGRKDPGSFVLDEVAGICLTVLLLPIYRGRGEALALGAAFVAFRIFDIAKPWPCRALEKLPAGWGILMDDLAAAIYANIVCQLVLRLGMGA